MSYTITWTNGDWAFQGGWLRRKHEPTCKCQTYIPRTRGRKVPRNNAGYQTIDNTPKFQLRTGMQTQFCVASLCFTLTISTDIPCSFPYGDFYLFSFLFPVYLPLGICLILLHRVAHLLSFWTCGKRVINTMVTSTPWPVLSKKLEGHTRNSLTWQNPSLMKPTSTTAGKMDSSPPPLLTQTTGQLWDLCLHKKSEAVSCPVAG